MNILITGAAGFMGSHVAKYLSVKGLHRIVCLDRAGGIHESCGLIRSIDLANKHDLEQLFKSEQFEAVIHLAAMTNPGEALSNPTFCYMSNCAFDTTM